MDTIRPSLFRKAGFQSSATGMHGEEIRKSWEKSRYGQKDGQEPTKEAHALQGAQEAKETAAPAAETIHVSRHIRKEALFLGISSYGPSPPEGFRAAGMSQALMEYIQPLLDRAGKSADMNNVFNLGMTVYNFALARETGDTPEHSQEILEQRLGRELGIRAEEAGALLQEMVERKQYLLPDELQTHLSSNIMFIRKTKRIEIASPDPAEMPSEIVAPNDSQDLEELFSCLDMLEQSRKHNKEPEDYQNLQERVPALAASCFEQWLRESDTEMNPETLSQFVRMFVDFVYGYLPPDVGRLREHGLPPEGHREFLFQHLTRKLYLEDPSQFAYAPVAIYLFYGFLIACEWLDEEAAEAALEVHELKEEFLEMLRRDFS